MDDEAQAAIDRCISVCKLACVEPEKEAPPDLKAKLTASGIPKRYLHASFEKLGRDGCPPDVRDMATEAYMYAKDFTANAEEGRGLLFFGEVGRMKTTLAVCVARAVIEKERSVFFISMPELLDTLISMSKNKDTKELRDFEHRIKTVSLLILDDFGAEYPNDWILNKVDAIITHRYNEMKSVIITTNMMPSEIKERYVQRVYDRLRSTSKVLGTYGDSFRKAAE